MDINLTNDIGSLGSKLYEKLAQSIKSAHNTDLISKENFVVKMADETMPLSGDDNKSAQDILAKTQNPDETQIHNAYKKMMPEPHEKQLAKTTVTKPLDPTEVPLMGKQHPLANMPGSFASKLYEKLEKTIDSARSTDLNPKNNFLIKVTGENPFQVIKDPDANEQKSATAVNDEIGTKATPEAEAAPMPKKSGASTESMPTPAAGTRKEAGDNPVSNNDMRTPFTLNSQKLVMTEYNPLTYIKNYGDKFEMIDANEKEIKENELIIETAHEHEDPAQLPKEKIKEQKPLETGAKMSRTEKYVKRKQNEAEAEKADIDLERIRDAKTKKLEEDLALAYEKIEKDNQKKRDAEREEAITQQTTRLFNERQETIAKDIDARLEDYNKLEKEIQNTRIEKNEEIQANTEKVILEEREAKSEKLTTEINKDIDKNFQQKYEDDKQIDAKLLEERIFADKENEKIKTKDAIRDENFRQTTRKEKQDFNEREQTIIQENLTQEIKTDQRIKEIDRNEHFNAEVEKTYAKHKTRIQENRKENIEVATAYLESTEKEAIEARKDDVKLTEKAKEDRVERYIKAEDKRVKESNEEFFGVDKEREIAIEQNLKDFRKEIKTLRENDIAYKKEMRQDYIKRQEAVREDTIREAAKIDEKIRQDDVDIRKKTLQEKSDAINERFDYAEENKERTKQQERIKERNDESRRMQAEKEARNEEDQARENARRKNQRK